MDTIRYASNIAVFDTIRYIMPSLLETVTSAKYLGVHVSSKLTWNEHIDIIKMKASHTLNFIRRNFLSCPNNQ